MEEDKNAIKLPEKSIEKLKVLFGEKQIAEGKLGIYLQAVMDTLGLEGKWNLDTPTWTFNRLPEPEAEK